MRDLVTLLPLSAIVVLCVAALVAGIMRGFSGFGGGLLIAPAFSLFMSPTDVVVVVVLLNLLTTVQLLPEVLRNVHWGTVLRLAATAALIGVPVGVATLHKVDPVMLRRTIGAIVFVTAILLLMGWNYRGRRGRIQDGVVGFFAGLLTSIGGVGGPPVILYLLTDQRLAQHVFRAIVIMLFLILQLVTLSQIGLVGAFTLTQGVYVLILLPVYVLAHWLGERAFLKYGEQRERFRRVALWSLLSVGLIALVV